MTDEIPADLVELKRQFYATERELAELAAAMPKPTAVIAGKAANDPAARDRWNILQRRLGDVALQIRRHPAFEGLSPVDHLTLDTAASSAARQES